MLAKINSPLMQLPHTQELGQAKNHIPLFETVGILLSLYALHWQHNSQSIKHWLERVLPFLQHQQARLFLTEDRTPYGFASWVAVPEATHQQLLNNATWSQIEIQITDLLEQPQKQAGTYPTYLWFVDLITPFSHALAATLELKQQMSQHVHAWAININQGQQSPRQIW